MVLVVHESYTILMALYARASCTWTHVHVCTIHTCAHVHAHPHAHNKNKKCECSIILTCFVHTRTSAQFPVVRPWNGPLSKAFISRMAALFLNSSLCEIAHPMADEGRWSSSMSSRASNADCCSSVSGVIDGILNGTTQTLDSTLWER